MGSSLNQFSGYQRPNPDGTKTIWCRACGRPVARAHGALVSTVSECIVCQLVNSGRMTKAEAEEYTRLKYTQPNLMEPPRPLTNPEDEIITLYEDEAIETKHGKFGFLRPLFKVIAWIVEPEEKPEEELPSVAAARRKKNKGLFSLEE